METEINDRVELDRVAFRQGGPEKHRHPQRLNGSLAYGELRGRERKQSNPIASRHRGTLPQERQSGDQSRAVTNSSDAVPLAVSG